MEKIFHGRGWKVARELRRQPGFRGVRLAALSGYAREEDRERSRDAGFDAHLAKPADPELRRLLEGPVKSRASFLLSLSGVVV